jgi:uncharacterized protein YjeT (DUF2065 family)
VPSTWRDALARSDAVEDERLRRVTREGIVTVLHPSVMEQLRSAAMIDTNLLRRRGFVVGADVEARLLSMTDPARIERWADLALDAPSLDAVFADD